MLARQTAVTATSAPTGTGATTKASTEMGKDWEIKSVAKSTRSKYLISGINHCWPEGNIDREFIWHVDSLDNPRYFFNKHVVYDETCMYDCFSCGKVEFGNTDICQECV